MDATLKVEPIFFYKFLHCLNQFLFSADINHGGIVVVVAGINGITKPVPGITPS
jgi:hypothetical protein